MYRNIVPIKIQNCLLQLSLKVLSVCFTVLIKYAIFKIAIKFVRHIILVHRKYSLSSNLRNNSIFSLLHAVYNELQILWLMLTMQSHMRWILWYSLLGIPYITNVKHFNMDFQVSENIMLTTELTRYICSFVVIEILTVPSVTSKVMVTSLHWTIQMSHSYTLSHETSRCYNVWI
jgi:hypothetical protein